MSRPKRQPWALRGVTGMNVSDPRISLLPGQVRTAQNVDLFDGGLGQKRNGFRDTFALPVGGTPVETTSTVVHLHRHVPDGADANAELWAVIRNDASGAIRLFRWNPLPFGAWTVIPLPDIPNPGSFAGQRWSMVTFNGKLFIAYDSGVNRLHVWDGLSVRRVGLAPPAVAPGLASIGPGALSFTRHYRVRFNANLGTPITALRSEPSPSASITIAASAGVRVTRPALVDGNEGSWHVEAANTANGPYFVIGVVPIGTLTFDDTFATIFTDNPSPEIGSFTLPPSAKYLSVFMNQILMAGAWETTAIAGQTVPKNNRVWFTRVLGTFDISDDESIPNTLEFKFWVDLGEDDDQVNGLSFPLDGIPYATKFRQFWALNPTDSADQPFRTIRITDSIGCRDYRTIVIGEDEYGSPALYWNSYRGPYRMRRGGIQYLGRDLGGLVTVADRAIWFSDQRQVWFTNGIDWQIFNVRFGRTDETNDVRSGWALYTLDPPASRSIRAMALYPFGFNNSDPILQPVFGGTINSGVNPPYIWQRGLANTTDGTTPQFPYQAFIRTGDVTLGDLLYNVSVFPPRIYAEPYISTTATIQCAVARNLRTADGEIQQISAVTVFTNAGPPLEVVRIGVFEGINWSDAEAYSFRLGDASALTQGWRMLAFLVPYQQQEEAE